MEHYRFAMEIFIELHFVTYDTINVCTNYLGG